MNESKHGGEQKKPRLWTLARHQAQKARKAAYKRYEKAKNACVDTAGRVGRWWKRQQPDRQLTLSFEFVIAFAAVVSMAVTCQQSGLTRSALRQTRESNNIARRAMEADSRAWVLVREFNVVSLGEPEVLDQFKLELFNFGNSPAFMVRTKCEARMRWGSMKPPKPVLYMRSIGDPVIAPDNDNPVTFKADSAWSPDAYKEFQAGQRTLWLRCRIDYRDPSDRHRKTKYCRFFHRDRNGICHGWNGAK